MKQLLVGLLVGLITTSGWAEVSVPYSPELLKKAESGDAEAQCSLASSYKHGKGVPKDEKEAIKWYTKAAEQGNPDGQYVVGMGYLFGTHGFSRNPNTAYKLIQSSADKGDENAKAALGFCYYQGAGVRQDYQKAFQLFKEAAEKGNMVGESGLGFCYMFGQGVEKNDDEAFRWTKKAAEHGERTAAANLGILYLQGKGVERNVVEGIKWIDQGNKNSSAGSQRRLGMDYESGSGYVPKDLKKAFILYGKSAEKGFCCGIYNLGLCYLNGVGTEKNYEKGIELLRKAKGMGCDYATKFLNHERFSAQHKAK